MSPSKTDHIPFFARPFVYIGSGIMLFVAEAGAMGIFLLHGFAYTLSSWRQVPKVLRQLRIIGSGSFFLIALIGLFTGMVLGLQLHYTLSQFGAAGSLGAVLSLVLIRELAPVLTAIMLTGRAGSAMAAELGVMRISQQIDALHVMDIPPMGYLVSTRITASLIAFPLLTCIFTCIALFGGYLTGILMLGGNEGAYLARMEGSVNWTDVSGCLAKAITFAIIVVGVCCYKGFFAHMRTDGRGPEAVSNATTSAVVLSCVLILAADYVLTSFLL